MSITTLTLASEASLFFFLPFFTHEKGPGPAMGAKGTPAHGLNGKGTKRKGGEENERSRCYSFLCVFLLPFGPRVSG